MHRYIVDISVLIYQYTVYVGTRPSCICRISYTKRVYHNMGQGNTRDSMHRYIVDRSVLIYRYTVSICYRPTHLLSGLPHLHVSVHAGRFGVGPDGSACCCHVVLVPSPHTHKNSSFTRIQHTDSLQNQNNALSNITSLFLDKTKHVTIHQMRLVETILMNGRTYGLLRIYKSPHTLYCLNVLLCRKPSLKPIQIASRQQNENASYPHTTHTKV